MKYISLKKYMELYNVGYNVALQMLHSDKLQYIKTESGHYKIAIYDDNLIPIEQYEKLLRENEKLKQIIRNINLISEEVLNG